MKKWLAVLMVVAALAGATQQATAAGKDAGAATLLSAVMPGVGEWYNGDWKGSFPFAECIVGHLCFCVQLSSIMDAANGNNDSGLRIDFWSAPVK